jgi:hypothetical protein
MKLDSYGNAVVWHAPSALVRRLTVLGFLVQDSAVSGTSVHGSQHAFEAGTGEGREGRGGGGSGGTDSVSSASAPSMALLDSEDPVELSAGALMMLDSPIVVVVVSCRSRKEHGHLNSR